MSWIVQANASRCFICPSYANCDIGSQIFPKFGFYVVTTKTKIPGFDKSRLDKISENMTKFEGNLVYLYANYLFIKCERVEFKKTGCRLFFWFFFFFLIFQKLNLDKIWAKYKKITLTTNSLDIKVCQMKMRSTNVMMVIRGYYVLLVIERMVTIRQASLFVKNVLIILSWNSCFEL